MVDNPHSMQPGWRAGAIFSGSGEALRGRMTLLLALAAALAAVLVVGIAMRAFGESGGVNSYALLADAFLNGRLHTNGCFDVDCALFEGRNYVAFPPAPALIAMPFVAVFGDHFAGFVLIAALMSAGALFLWWRIFEILEVERATAAWLVLAIAFATPLYYVTVRGDGIWFFAQATAFVLSTAALWLTLSRSSLVLAGCLMGLSFLSRQMTIFLMPFLFALALGRGEPLVSLSREHFSRLFKLGLPVAAAIGIYFAYNYARFGSPLDTGYLYIYQSVPEAERNFLNLRATELGVFSPEFLLSNVMHLFVQGFHADFGGRYLTEIGGLDPLGTSLLAASPFVLLAVFTPMSRTVLVGLACIAAMVMPMLFYHSNGFTQYNAQRYVVDWLPILAYLLALAVRPALRPALAVLVVYGIGLNVVAAMVLALTGT